MNIGVYIGGGLPEQQAGGAFTLPECLLRAIHTSQTNHKFFIFFYGHSLDIPKSLPQHITYVPLHSFYPAETDNFVQRASLKLRRFFDKRETIKKYNSYLNRACRNVGIELMWFMTPSYEFVDVPYLYTVWDLQHRHQSYFPEVSVTGSPFEEREKFYQKVLPQAAYVITGNRTAQQEVMQYYHLPIKRVKTIEFPTPDFVFGKHNSDIVSIKKKYNISYPYLFYPAQFWPHKNHIVLIKALKILQEQGKKFHIIFTGSDKGNLQYIKQYVQAEGLEKYVHFLGFVSTAELVQLYKEAFALVFPSFFGPNNIPPLEAGALHCPVICADADGMKEQLNDAALYFNPVHEHNLVDKILELEDIDTRKRLISTGYERACSWQANDYLKQIFAIVDEFAPIRRCWSSTEPYIHT